LRSGGQSTTPRHKVEFRIVRTINPDSKWDVGKNELDLDFPLPATAPALENLEFIAQDEGLNIVLTEEITPADDDDGGDVSNAG
jgi:hypothetical protein